MSMEADSNSVAAANAADAMLGAERGLRHLNGTQFGSVYHGTEGNWSTVYATHDSPLHVDTDKHDFPEERAFGPAYFGGATESETWDAMQRGRVKEFKFRPDARVHVTQTPHADGILPDDEAAAVERGGYDATMFPKRRSNTESYGTVYNAGSLEHVKDHRYRDVTGRDPEDTMEDIHGEDWRDWI